MRHATPLLALVLAPALLAQSSSGYRITHTYTLGGNGSWDANLPP